MEFLTERCYTALNADELKIGSKVIVANTIGNLKELVEQNMAELSDLTRIDNTYSDRRFVVNEDTDRINSFAFAYLVSEPEGLKWTDLKIGDVIHEKDGTETRMITGIDTRDEVDDDCNISHICASGWWCTDEILKNWEKVE